MLTYGHRLVGGQPSGATGVRLRRPSGEEAAVKLVVFVLNDEELLEEVLEAYTEVGIPGGTILDSEGMGRFMTYEIPLFAGFQKFMKGNKPYNKTIFSVVRDESLIPRLHRLLNEVCGDLGDPGTGVLFTVPVDWAVGLAEEEED